MNTQVARPVTDDELGDYLRCVMTAFHSDGRVTDERVTFFRDRWPAPDRTRLLGAFADGGLRGTAASFATDLTVPGGVTVPTAAVTQVTVLPTHRRRGLLTELMKVQLADAIERGEVAAMLVAAEWPIYGRFGYGMAVEAAVTMVDARAARFVDPNPAGHTELVDAAGLRAMAPEPFDRHRLTSPGAITRDEPWWDVITGVVRQPGDDEPKNRVRVVHRDGRRLRRLRRQ
jgi:predicted N-acetyltransferase YhbS